jgi:hypothetical protein
MSAAIFLREIRLRIWSLRMLESFDGRTEVGPHELDPAHRGIDA